MKNADGIILATTIEWYGIGGYMQQFLDACWLYGDKEKIAKIYMCPIVMSTTYGEREGKLNLTTAWEILGGKPCSGICGYIADTVTLELNEQYTQLIEKKAENMYRSINQKMPSFPASNQAVKQMVSITRNVDLTPQETEQLSQYISDDSYVQRQKEDIQELASLFRNKLVKEDDSYEDAYLADMRQAYQGGEDTKATFAILIGDREQPLILKLNRGTMECCYRSNLDADVEMSLPKTSFEEIISGRMTFQRAFMSGAMKMKGDFMMLRMLDQCFIFKA
jgi:multimeric flavodoxin WrbA/putative sterol carrier protein